MDDYISRSAVLAKAYWHGDSCTQSNPYSDGVEAVDVSAIEQISAADVQLVVRGKWEPGKCFCPVCGEDKFKNLEADIWADWQPNFCPNCGADMRSSGVLEE